MAADTDIELGLDFFLVWCHNSRVINLFLMGIGLTKELI